MIRVGVLLAVALAACGDNSTSSSCLDLQAEVFTKIEACNGGGDNPFLDEKHDAADNACDASPELALPDSFDLDQCIALVRSSPCDPPSSSGEALHADGVSWTRDAEDCKARLPSYAGAL